MTHLDAKALLQQAAECQTLNSEALMQLRSGLTVRDSGFKELFNRLQNMSDLRKAYWMDGATAMLTAVQQAESVARTEAGLKALEAGGCVTLDQLEAEVKAEALRRREHSFLCAAMFCRSVDLVRGLPVDHVVEHGLSVWAAHFHELIYGTPLPPAPGERAEDG